MGTQRAAARLGCRCQVRTPLTLLDEKPQFLCGEYKSQERFFFPLLPLPALLRWIFAVEE